MHDTGFFRLETGQATDVGCIRKVNEDSFLTRPDYGLWVVSDGMGGHAAGDFASQTIVEQLNSVGVPASAEDLHARVMVRLRQANDLILAQAKELDRGVIGATLVALLVHQDDFAVLWSGDSRAYLLRDGQLVQQSRDHTELRSLLDAGAITPEEALSWPRKNVITKAIGVSPEPEVELVAGRLARGDVVLLCSDGLTEHLSDPEILRFLQSAAPQHACAAMIQTTLERGARDNVTVVAVQFHPPEPAATEDLDFDDDASWHAGGLT